MKHGIIRAVNNKEGIALFRIDPLK